MAAGGEFEPALLASAFAGGGGLLEELPEESAGGGEEGFCSSLASWPQATKHVAQKNAIEADFKIVFENLELIFMSKISWQDFHLGQQHARALQGEKQEQRAKASRCIPLALSYLKPLVISEP